MNPILSFFLGFIVGGLMGMFVVVAFIYNRINNNEDKDDKHKCNS